tara:strand:- start:185 stop:499 length:315 start_codon:yes stop_codon:yes gene_type:complete
MLGEVAQELLVAMEHLLEEVMVEMGCSRLLQEQQHIMPVVVVEEHIIPLHPLEEEQEAKVEVELEEQLDRIAPVYLVLQIPVVGVVVHQPLAEGIQVVELGALV